MRNAVLWALLTLPVLGARSALAQDAGPPEEPPQAAVSDPASEPAAEESSPAPASAGEDLAQLRAELSRVLDELIQARTRATVLAKNLFRTRIDITLLRRADDQSLGKLRLLLDGVPVHDSDGASVGGDEVKLFDGFVAPGVHEIGIEIAERAKENPEYRYVRKERFRIEVRKDTRAKVDIILRDRSDMAEELPDGDDGSYDVRTEVRVEPIEEAL